MNVLTDLVDYRDRTQRIYALVRERLDEGDPVDAHRIWRTGRDDLWRTHPSSPVPVDQRDDWPGLPCWDYDPQYAHALPFQGNAPLEGRDEVVESVLLPGHKGPWGEASPADFRETPHGEIFLFWLQQYGGGLFMAFKDKTNGAETYGGGRYLIDTPKGAWLGVDEDGLMRFDFNFAYHPSCARSPEWNCPLALDPPLAAIRAGEQLERPAWS